MNLKRIIYLIWFASPRQNFNRIKTFINKNKIFYYSIEDILNDQKHINPAQLIDRGERYIRVINNNFPDCGFKDNFKIKDKIVFELGSGPLLGWGPISLFLGARKFIFSEVAFNAEVLKSKLIEEKYFLPLYEELVANYGELMSYEFFLSKIRNDSINIINEDNYNCDIVLSNSVLEHVKIIEIQKILKKISANMSKGSYFIHAVDFSSHLKDKLEIYKNKKNKNSNSLNYLRFSDIAELIQNSGVDILGKVIYRTKKLNSLKIHKSWKKYKTFDLEVMTAIYFGIKRN
tara:strand:- start:515 stop:1381 length:867 start_codon:yes stop_codon:yes gene_type:complete